MIRVLIVHETFLVSNALANVLQDESDVKVVGLAATYEEALDQLNESIVDMVLVNANRPSQQLLSFIQSICRNYSNTKIVIMSVADTSEFILQCFQAGATGYSLQTDSLAELMRKVRAAYSGKPLLSPQIAGALVSRIAELSQIVGRPNADQGDLMLLSADLTPREREVLSYLERGSSNQEIADALTIEVGTVKNHVHNILKKLNVDNRKRAGLLARQVMTDENVWHVETPRMYSASFSQ
ncbi:MAG: response regulator transcription factor [Caldilineaceae bacterium]|nr:response regulator transcription factor [Caldilineaceae bacterium]